ncbi:MAG: succinylglutamate desuccinylase/aspartoacylase family protein [Bacillota bacterium]
MGSKAVQVGSVNVAPGEKGHGFLELGQRKDGTPIRCPLMIVNGASQGPVLWVQSCIHGDEFEGMQAIVNLYRMLDACKLGGALVAIPVVNVPAWETMERLTPMDGGNLNGAFPGMEDGPATARMAYIITREVLRTADYALDLHGGGNALQLLPYTAFHQEGDAGARSRELAEAYGFDLMLKTQERKGWVAGTFYAEITARGVPAVLAEAGYEGRLDEKYVTAHFEGLMNVMRALGMIDGDVRKSEKPCVVAGNEAVCVRANRGGILKRTVTAGQLVEKDETLAYIVDFFEETLEIKRSPRSGVVLDLRTKPLVNQGDMIAFICPVCH